VPIPQNSSCPYRLASRLARLLHQGLNRLDLAGAETGAGIALLHPVERFPDCHALMDTEIGDTDTGRSFHARETVNIDRGGGRDGLVDDADGGGQVIREHRLFVVAIGQDQPLPIKVLGHFGVKIAFGGIAEGQDRLEPRIQQLIMQCLVGNRADGKLPIDNPAKRRFRIGLTGLALIHGGGWRGSNPEALEKVLHGDACWQMGGIAQLYCFNKLFFL
jgi:hypothetical protein